MKFLILSFLVSVSAQAQSAHYCSGAAARAANSVKKHGIEVASVQNLFSVFSEPGKLNETYLVQFKTKTATGYDMGDRVTVEVIADVAAQSCSVQSATLQ